MLFKLIQLICTVASSFKLHCLGREDFVGPMLAWAWADWDIDYDQDGEEEKTRKRLKLWTADHGVEGGYWMIDHAHVRRVG